MSLSVVLWFVWFTLSAFMLCFWLWTNYILFRQKAAWKVFAEKRKLRYYSRRFSDNPSMSGAIDEYKISVFISEHFQLDARSHKNLTAIEVSLHSGLSVSGALASGGMVPVIETLDIHQEFRPSVKGWDDSYIVRTRDADYMRSYLTPERMEGIVRLMNIDKAWLILIFIAGEPALLRLDTPFPLDNPKEVDAVIKQMIYVARLLELRDGEERELQRNRSKSDKKQKVLDVDDALLEDDIGLELENDEGDQDKI